MLKDLSVKLAVFDVCGTLYSCNLLFSFARCQSELKRSVRFADSFFVKCLDALCAKLQIRRRIFIRSLGKLPQPELNERAAVFVNNYLPKFIRKNIFLDLENLKNRSYKVVLLSAAPEFIVKEVAKYCSADSFHATKIVDGRVTSETNCLKQNFVTKYEPYNYLYVCTDNLGDIELLRLADNYTILARPKNYLRWKKAFDPERIKLLQDWN